MNNEVACSRKAVFSRCLKPFKKQKSHEVKEYGNCCSSLQKKNVLTGCAEIAKSKIGSRMGIKLFVFFLCTSGFLYQTWSFLQIYLAYPTTLDISEEYPASFLAPAMTVCNKNRLLRQPYCKMYPQKCTWEHTTWESFCDRYRRMCPYYKPQDFNFGIPVAEYLLTPNRSNEFLNAVAQEDEANIILSYHNINGIQNLNSVFQMVIFQNHGLPYRCYTLFSLMSNNKETFNLTLSDGYLVLLALKPEEYFNTYDLVQASFVLHDPRKIVNPMTEGITLTSGKIYRFFMTMERRESLPPPYASNCMDYLAKWKEYGGQGPLSKDGCINECKIRFNLHDFGCLGQSMTYATASFPICFHPSYETTSEMNTICDSICPDACEDNIYHITADEVIDHGTMCSPTDEHCKSQYLLITVSFDRMKIKKFKQIPRFESIELFSYIGGYLGLWLGISLAAVFDVAEMIYDVISKAFLKRARNKKRITSIEQLQHHTAVNKIRKNIFIRTKLFC